MGKRPQPSPSVRRGARPVWPSPGTNIKHCPSPLPSFFVSPVLHNTLQLLYTSTSLFLFIYRKISANYLESFKAKVSAIFRVMMFFGGGLFGFNSPPPPSFLSHSGTSLFHVWGSLSFHLLRLTLQKSFVSSELENDMLFPLLCLLLKNQHHSLKEAVSIKAT